MQQALLVKKVACKKLLVKKDIVFFSNFEIKNITSLFSKKPSIILFLKLFIVNPFNIIIFYFYV
jgi:hypothetical protein